MITTSAGHRKWKCILFSCRDVKGNATQNPLLNKRYFACEWTWGMWLFGVACRTFPSIHSTSAVRREQPRRVSPHKCFETQMLEQHQIKCCRSTVQSTGRNTKPFSPLIPHGFADGQTYPSEAYECALHYIFINSSLTVLLVISPCTNG